MKTAANTTDTYKRKPAGSVICLAANFSWTYKKNKRKPTHTDSKAQLYR